MKNIDFGAEFSLQDLCSNLASLATPLLVTLLLHSHAAGKLVLSIDRVCRPRPFSSFQGTQQVDILRYIVIPADNVQTV